MTTSKSLWGGIKEPTREEKLAFYKKTIDKTPSEWLNFHLDNAVKGEDYELAAYIRDTIIKRNDS